jgi:hypothetical protein
MKRLDDFEDTLITVDSDTGREVRTLNLGNALRVRYRAIRTRPPSPTELGATLDQPEAPEYAAATDFGGL